MQRREGEGHQIDPLPEKTTLKIPGLSRVNVYRQHIKQQQYQQIKTEQHLQNCGKGEFLLFPYLKVKENRKTLRKFYETSFKGKYKMQLNQHCQLQG